MTLALENLYGLRIRTPRVELRIPTNSDIKLLHRVARGGVHDTSVMPFEDGWTDRAEPDFGRNMQAELRQGRNSLGRAQWNVPFIVRARDTGGTAIGVQWLHATDVPGQVETSMWLAQRVQGKGYGREMTAAALGFAFDHLRIDEAVAGAFAFNEAARSVARAFGFTETPGDALVNRGEPAEYVRLTLDAATYRALAEPVPVQVSGFDRVQAMFPATQPPAELVLGDR